MQQPVDEFFVLRFMMEGVLEPENPSDDILKYTIELACPYRKLVLLAM